jgi:hypothetical protein
MASPTRAVTTIPTVAAPPATAAMLVEEAVDEDDVDEVDLTEVVAVKSRDTGVVVDPNPLGWRFSEEHIWPEHGLLEQHPMKTGWLRSSHFHHWLPVGQDTSSESSMLPRRRSVAIRSLKCPG